MHHLLSHTFTYLITYSLNYLLLTPRSTVLENLTDLQLVKKFPAIYGTRKIITAFTSARHLSLSWASAIRSLPPHPISWRSILILSSHLRLGLPSITKDSNQILMMKPNCKCNRNTSNNFRGKNLSASTCEVYWLLSPLDVVWILTSLLNIEQFSLTGFPWGFWHQFQE
jgi:hypothetical protein